MTIVEYFDPRNGEHLTAWRKFEAEYPENPHGAWRNLAASFGLSIDDDWPVAWVRRIKDKMADAWMEEQLGSEPDKRVAGDLRVSRLRRGGGETPHE